MTEYEKWLNRQLEGSSLTEELRSILNQPE